MSRTRQESRVQRDDPDSSPSRSRRGLAPSARATTPLPRRPLDGDIARVRVCNATESCEDPQHQVDNIGAEDWVLFQFSVPVDVTSVRIDHSTPGIVTCPTSSAMPGIPLNLTGVTYAGLGGVGFGGCRTIRRWQAPCSATSQSTAGSPMRCCSAAFSAEMTGTRSIQDHLAERDDSGSGAGHHAAPCRRFGACCTSSAVTPLRARPRLGQACFPPTIGSRPRSRC